MTAGLWRRGVVAVAGLVLLLGIGAGSALAGPKADKAPHAGQTHKVLIDTDMGWDDTLSILYLMKHPRVEIVGITVTGCGETFLESGVHNALALLQMGGIEAPVSVGAATPLKFGHKFPKSFKSDMSDLMGLAADYPKLDREPIAAPAWDFIAQTLETAEEEITILSLGGFTNVAKMLEQHPQARTGMIDSIVAMAGAVYVDGNVAGLNNAKKQWNQGPKYATNHYAEFNVFVDPLAAQQVFASSIPITLVPLDACDYVILERRFMDRITAKDPIADLVKKIFAKKTGSSSEGIPVPIFDPLATLIMAGGVQPAQVHALPLAVRLEEEPQDNHCGQTVIQSQGADKLIRVVQGVSERAFKQDFAAVINRDMP
jgi:purine nucleosidase